MGSATVQKLINGPWPVHMAPAIEQGRCACRLSDTCLAKDKLHQSSDPPATQDLILTPEALLEI
jgi:hypothetical protein